MAYARTSLRDKQSTRTLSAAVDENGATLNVTARGNGITPARRLVIRNNTGYTLADDPVDDVMLGVIFDDPTANITVSPRAPALVLEGEFYEIDVLSSSNSTEAAYSILCIY